MGSKNNPEMDAARDELFSHINRCAVLKAEADQQREWMEETVEYLAERYPALGDAELEELRAIGMRFCSPVIAHGKENTALDAERTEQTGDSSSDEEEAAA